MPSFFHVLYSKTPDGEYSVLYTDLDERGLLNKAIKPYKRGASQMMGGSRFNFSDIQRIKIIETDEQSSACLKKLYDRSSQEMDNLNRNSSMKIIGIPYGLATEDIEHCGTNVTDKYISGTPGAGDWLTSVSAFFSNPWVLTVGTGVILLLVGLLFT